MGYEDFVVSAVVDIVDAYPSHGPERGTERGMKILGDFSIATRDFLVGIATTNRLKRVFVLTEL